MSQGLPRLLALILAIVAATLATNASACTKTDAVATDFGTFSSQSIKQNAVPSQFSRAGLLCPTSTIVLLGGNYIAGKFQSKNAMKLVSGANSISYTASAAPGSVGPYSQNGTVDYMQNNLLNVLGLLGGSNADLPIYIKPVGGALPPPGIYTDKITMTWNWYLCPSVNALFVCLATPSQGTNVVTTIDVTLTVGPRSILLTTSSGTTWDPVNGTAFPKALPGGRRRLALNVTNPDLVAIDNNTLGLNVAVPSGTMIALDGDGTSSGAFLSSMDGTPASSLTVTYSAPESTADDVDFSADRGATWSYVPVPGNDASQAAVTNVRLRPKGTMAPGSQFGLSIALKVK
jgi:hypothetical protein